MTYNEIYKFFIFWISKIDYNKIRLSTKNSLIIVTGSAKSAKQRGTQINIKYQLS
jgi:hypothetical protein